MIIQFGGTKPAPSTDDALLQEPGSIPPGETVIHVREIVEDFTRRVPAPVRIVAARIVPGLAVAGIVTLTSIGLHSCSAPVDPPRKAVAFVPPVTVTVAAAPSPAAASPSVYVAPENVPTTTCEPLPPSGGVAATVNSCGNDIRPGAGSVEDQSATDRSAAAESSTPEVTQKSGPNLLQRILSWAGGALGWLAALLRGGR